MSGSFDLFPEGLVAMLSVGVGLGAQLAHGGPDAAVEVGACVGTERLVAVVDLGDERERPAQRGR